MSTEKIKRVGGDKNAHGTRVLRKVKCSKCSKLDFISFVPGRGKEAFCKSCAETLCNALEVGQAEKIKFVKKNCPNCAQPYEIESEKLAYIEEQKKRVRLKRPDEEDKPMLCPNCYMGFELWSGKKDSNQNLPSSLGLSKRKSGAILRKG